MTEYDDARVGESTFAARRPKDVLSFLEQNEALGDPRFTLQTPQEFRDDFVAHATLAQHLVKAMTMQFEAGIDTNPIYEAMIEAKQRGVDVELDYDSFSLVSISRDGVVSPTYKNRVLNKKATREVLKKPLEERNQLLAVLEKTGVADPANRSLDLRNSYNHIKLFIIDGVAWVGTMNLRESDFKMSNFMLKVTDPQLVAALKDIFEVSKRPESSPNTSYPNQGNSTELLFDGGNKKDSIIYERAVEMAESLQPGDRFVLINQWPPTDLMFKKVLQVLQSKAAQGATGKFLMPPEDELHFSKLASAKLQRESKKKEMITPNMQITNLARKTHIKAFLIIRADGHKEVLFGSHNLTSWTVRAGNKELSVWSEDTEITDQIDSYIEEIAAE